MSRNYSRIIILIILFCFFSIALLKADLRIVRVGIFPAAPLVMTKDGKQAGLFIELIEYFAKELGWNLQYVDGTWSEQLIRLEKEEIDLLPAVGYTNERTLIYDFSQHPVFIDSGVLFTGSKFIPHTIFDLKGKRIAALKGSIFTTGFIEYAASFGIQSKIILTKDNLEVMEKISNGECDAGVCIYSLGNELAKEYPVRITPISFSPIALHFAVPKGKNEDLKAGIDRLMSDMIEDPASVYSRAFSKWSSHEGSKKIPFWIFWILVGLFIFGVILIYWNVLLKHQVYLKTKHLEAEILERIHTEQEIKKLNNDLEERVVKRTEELESFSYSVSHDLKTPLRAISSFSKLALENNDKNLSSETLGFLEKINSAAAKMSKLIDDMLNLSKVTRSKVKKESFNISDLLHSIIEDLQTLSPDRKVKFICSDKINVTADFNLIKIAFQNLLGNAWKYTSNNPDAVIEVGIKNQDDKRVFFIKDNGAGFDMKYADKLFNPFYRLHTSDEFEGTGIGLAIVKRIISKHGGDIWVDSKKGVNTTIYFTL